MHKKQISPNLTLQLNRSTNVIIYINFVDLESLMLLAKFQDHQTSGSGEDLLNVFFYHIY